MSNLVNISGNYLYVIIICIIILFIFLIRAIWRSKDIKDRFMFLKIILMLVFISFIILILLFEVMIIYLAIESNFYVGLLWNILVSLLFMMYINFLGLKSKSGKGKMFLLIFIILIVIVSGLQFGLRVEFYEPVSNFLVHNNFQTNSADGIRFYGLNLHIFLLVYFTSIILESDS